MSDGTVIEAAIATEKQRDGSVPLIEYPKLSRPVILTGGGRVLVTVADLESVHEQRHRLLLQGAQSVFDDEEEDASANKDDGKKNQASEKPLPRLRVVKKRATVALPSAGKSEEEKDEDEDDDEDEDEDRDRDDKKKKKKESKKTESKEPKKTKLPKKRMWEDVDSDKDEDKGEGTSYKRPKTHAGGKADKKSK
jgi:hypothetical protein